MVGGMHLAYRVHARGGRGEGLPGTSSVQISLPVSEVGKEMIHFQ